MAAVPKVGMQALTAGLKHLSFHPRAMEAMKGC